MRKCNFLEILQKHQLDMNIFRTLFFILKIANIFVSVLCFSCYYIF